MSLRCVSVVLTLFANLVLVRPIHAECIIPGAWWLQSPAFDVVFSGTVTRIERTGDVTYRATVRVQRVWRGKLQRQVTVDVNELAPETPLLQNNIQYLLAAKRREQTNPAMQMGAAALWLPSCSHMEFDEALKLDVLRQFGTGWPSGSG
jgi:hypothetical protein